MKGFGLTHTRRNGYWATEKQIDNYKLLKGLKMPDKENEPERNMYWIGIGLIGFIFIIGFIVGYLVGFVQFAKLV